VTVPPRSRTKPGSTTRRPKVAGLRQHAHVGTGTDRPDTDGADALDTVESPDAVATPAVDDREATTATTTPEAPADDERTAVVDADTHTSGTTDTTESADTTALSMLAATPETAETSSDTSRADTATGTAIDTAPADRTASDTTATDSPDTTDTVATGAVTTETAAPTDVPADADTTATDTTGTDATATDATARTAAAPLRGKSRKRGGMTPRAEAATAPSTERPARRGRTADDTDTVTASPTRTARPTRTGGKRGAPEAAPSTGRLARVRAALARFGSSSRALPITLVVVIVVCLVLSGLAFWQDREARTTGPFANQAVVDVGGTAELVGQTRESIERIFSYDHTRLDESVDAARSMSTGQFTDRYLAVFDQTIRGPALQQQLKQTATVVNLGVMTMQDDRADVMVLAQFSAQRATTGQSTNAPGLLRLLMERVDGRWKLAELTPLTAQPPAPN
jgi:Mce-associated membrane protein